MKYTLTKWLFNTRVSRVELLERLYFSLLSLSLSLSLAHLTRLCLGCPFTEANYAMQPLCITNCLSGRFFLFLSLSLSQSIRLIRIHSVRSLDETQVNLCVSGILPFSLLELDSCEREKEREGKSLVSLSLSLSLSCMVIITISAIMSDFWCGRCCCPFYLCIHCGRLFHQ